MHIRKARMADVEAMSRVLIASITELCGADHGGDESSVQRWTANKSPDALRLWMADPANGLFVAEQGGEILCVGAFRGSEVQLNFVRPSHRFRGLSKAMLQRLEEEMRNKGVVEAQLTSTATAREFYRSAGWTETGEAIQMFGFARAYPMNKKLS